MRRRYEVWFVRLGLADGRGAWWFRYLLMNPGRAGGGGCPGNSDGFPVQVWATWFPRNGRPQQFIQGFSLDQLSLSQPAQSPFYFRLEKNRIEENSCAGELHVDGHTIRWDLSYRSTVGFTMSDVGWIGFSRTAHSDGILSGEIEFEGQAYRGAPIGYGLQGHNCGFRHRHLWNWAHCLASDPDSRGITTFEALEYEMPFGLRFRKALLWHRGRLYRFRGWKEICRERDRLQWMFHCRSAGGKVRLLALCDGSGPSLNRVLYLRTDCSSSFEVANNSLAQTTLYFFRQGQPPDVISTDGGAVVEMVGD